MKTSIHHIFVIVFIFACDYPAAAQGTAFTYQGRLNSGASAASGSYDLTFTLFGTNTSGVAIAGPVTNSATSVSNGLFTTLVDFGGGIFTGSSNWLEIAVRTNGTGSFATLTPRQQLTPTPYAITAENVTGGGLASGTYANAVTFNNSANSFSGSYAGNGSGLTNLNAANLSSGILADARLSSNVALRAGGNAFSGNQIITNGNLGIGAISPARALDVAQTNAGGVQTVAHFGSPTGNSGEGAAITLGTGNGAGQYFAKVSAVNEHSSPNYLNPALTFSTMANSYLAGSEVERMRISSVGNIGIGTASPGIALEVASTNTGGVQQIAHFGSLTGNAGEGSAITIGSHDAGQYFAKIAAVNERSSPNFLNPALTFSTMHSSYIAGSEVERMRITSDGLVGIGKMNPATALDVNGTVTALNFSGTGGGLTNLNAANISSGTLADALLSSNVPLLNATQSFTGVNSFNNNVGISGSLSVNTVTPSSTLTVAGDILMSGGNSYHNLSLSGGNSSGFLYGSYPAFGDGIHLGYNYYADAAGTGHVINPGGATSRLSLGYGYISLLAGYVNIAPSSGLTIYSGSVNVTTTSLGIGINNSNPQSSIDMAAFSNCGIYYRQIGGNNWWAGISSANDFLFQYGGANKAFIDTSGNYHQVSDRQLKRDITNLDNALDRLLQLRPVSYRFRSGPTNALLSLGLIAQEVQPLFPEVVGEGADGIKNLAYSELVPVTIRSIQELNHKLEAQAEQKDAEIQALKQSNGTLAKQLNELQVAVKSLQAKK